MAKTCDICGKPSGMFPLCKKCNEFKENNKIIKCENCGKWHYINNPCNCMSSIINKQIKIEEKPVIEEQKTNTCILCGENTENGFLFCKKCYYKYKNKSVVIKITNCTDVELLEANYEGSIVCNDGHIVKSMQEAMIDNYLFEEKIAHAYEISFPIDENKEHDLHPDFYLPEKKIYIEHWGIDSETNKDYKKTKEYKMPIYKQSKQTFIYTYKSDTTNIRAALNRKLKFYKENQVNFEE